MAQRPILIIVGARYGFDLDMNELVCFGDRNEPASLPIRQWLC